MKERVVAKIRRDGDGNWMVTFPGIRGAHTYGRSLNQLRRAASRRSFAFGIATRLALRS